LLEYIKRESGVMSGMASVVEVFFGKRT